MKIKGEKIKWVIKFHYLFMSLLILLLFCNNLLFKFGLFGNIAFIFGVAFAIYKPMHILKKFIYFDELVEIHTQSEKKSNLNCYLYLMISLIIFNGSLLYILISRNRSADLPIMSMAMLSMTELPNKPFNNIVQTKRKSEKDEEV